MKESRKMQACELAYESCRDDRFANPAAMIASFDLDWYLKHKHCPQTGARCEDVRKSCVTFCWLK